MSTSVPEEMNDMGHSLIELIFSKDAMAEYTLSVHNNFPLIKEYQK
jgi:hypothetical protein